MEKVHSSAGVTIYFNPMGPYILWQNETATTIDDYKKLTILLFDIIVKYKQDHDTLGVIMDIGKGGYRTSEEMQWAIDIWKVKALETGIHKWAMILPESDGPITGLAAFIEGAKNSVVDVRTFGTLAAAESWLKEMR